MKIGYFVLTTREIAEFKRCFYLAEHMVKMGHEATVVCVAPSYSPFITTEIRKGVKLIQLPYYLPPSLTPLKSSSPLQKTSVRPQEYLGQLLRGFLSPVVDLLQKSDVVHAFTVAFPMSAFPALTSKFVKKRRLVIDWVDLWSGSGWGSFHNGAIRFGLNLFEDSVVLFADALTVTSDFLAKRAMSLGVPNSKIFKIPSGANVDIIKPIDKDLARAELGYDKNLKILVYEGGSGGTGAMPDSFRLLLESLKIALTENHHIRLVIVGYSPNERDLQLVKALGIFNSVDFVPRQSYSRLALFLGIADLLVLPLENNEIFRAGMPGRFGDYICAGRPIVVSDIGDAAKVVSKEKIGLTAKTDSPIDFAQKIGEIVSNQELSDEFGKRARRVAENKYSWRNISKRVLAIYEDRLQSDYTETGEFKWK